MNPSEAWATIAAATAASHRALRAALDDPARAQRRLLRAILAMHATSAFGRRHHFDAIRDVREYRARVPVAAADGFAAATAASAHDREHRLVAREVVAYERTSGTTAPSRLVAYTTAALDGFRRAAWPWLHDLACGLPELTRGPAYLAISPATRGPQRTPGGIPVGLPSDAAYLGPRVGSALAACSAVPAGIGALRDADAWRRATLRHLVAAEELRLLSVWSPTFALMLVDGLRDDGPRLVDDIAAGRPVPGAATAPAPRPALARRLARAIASDPPDTRVLWPRLALVSCWTHAQAARYVPALARAFPQAQIQGKGLLATEAAVSVPLLGEPYPVLAVRSAFVELLADDGSAWLADEAEIGATYRVVVTTAGGLYRLDLGDRVRVRGRIGRTPTLELLGRDGIACDLCGEKLTECQVQAALPPGVGTAVLVPRPGPVPGYRLVLDLATHDEAGAAALAALVDQRLRANPHYDHARRVGQLAALEAAPRAEPLAHLVRHAVARGTRLGDVKPPLLYCGADWEEVFPP
ncbi:MAG: GH3 auxin-responsive promoter family protein [Ectothiorhodospiraceae bacterium]|nr:GH3 auxin-responsive promoter family protein [Ectothiorhodospiraceae bacterium]